MDMTTGEKGKKITKIQALRVLSNLDDWLSEALRNRKECSCGSCYLCAFLKLAGKVKWRVTEERE